MKMFIVQKVVSWLVDLLDEDLVKRGLDKAFDYIEDEVRDSSSKWDDLTILPVIKALRKALDVEEIEV